MLQDFKPTQGAEEGYTIIDKSNMFLSMIYSLDLTEAKNILLEVTPVDLDSKDTDEFKKALVGFLKEQLTGTEDILAEIKYILDSYTQLQNHKKIVKQTAMAGAAIVDTDPDYREYNSNGTTIRVVNQGSMGTVTPGNLKNCESNNEELRPDYYGGDKNPYEPWKIIDHYNMGFYVGNAIKYVCRAGIKNKATYREDLHKAMTYLKAKIQRIDREIDTEPENYTISDVPHLNKLLGLPSDFIDCPLGVPTGKIANKGEEICVGDIVRYATNDPHFTAHRIVLTIQGFALEGIKLLKDINYSLAIVKKWHEL